MAIIESRIQEIKDITIEMMVLVNKQLIKSQKALFENNVEITEEILISEKRVDAYDLKLNKDCEQFLALYSPVADDLRLVIAVLSISTFLERIGDNAKATGNLVSELGHVFPDEVLQKLQLKEMFELCNAMFEIVFKSFEEESTENAAKVFKMDKQIDKININALPLIADFIRNDLDNTEKYIQLISIIKKLERVGDLLTNISEETIFYVDAKVLKHKKKKQKKMIEKEEKGEN